MPRRVLEFLSETVTTEVAFEVGAIDRKSAYSFATEKGKEFFERVKARLNYVEVPFETIIPGNVSLYLSLIHI